MWLAALTLAEWMRYDFSLSSVRDQGILWVGLAAVIIQLSVGYFDGPYARNHAWGSFEETADVAKTAGITGLIIFVLNFVSSGSLHLPRSVPAIAFFLALAGMFAVRFVKRSWDTRRVTFSDDDRRVIIVGAGQTGRRLTQSMISQPASGFAPVAFVDDDASKRRIRLEGVRVRGTRKDIGRLAEELGAEAIVVAIPSISREQLNELSSIASDHNLALLSVPPVKDQLGGDADVQDLRDVDVADLLGRRPVELDTTTIAEQLNGKRILVTGAGGSIGSELCRQIAKFSPDKLFLLDRDESGLQATQMSLVGNGLLDSDEVVLADIRDQETLRRLFNEKRPDIVFHAAALKHLPLLEQYPSEAWQSNIIGTMNVLEAAKAIDVEIFVNISTDKAANPTCVLGYSKRLAERLTADFAARTPGRFVSVRFGNVLGSRGSVIHVFSAQIERGGPITVTHPDVERYFMLIPEACQLVLQAAVIGSDGEVMVLDMGDPMKIVDVANTLIRRSGRRDIDITYTGLRAGEKMSEELFSPHEPRRPSAHPLVSAVDVPAITPALVIAGSAAAPEAQRAWMKREAFVGLGVDDTATEGAHPALR